jgi:hypothetical protein
VKSARGSRVTVISAKLDESHNLLSTTTIRHQQCCRTFRQMSLSQFVDLSSPLRPTNAERLAVLDQIASLEPRLEDIKHQRNLAIAHLHSLQLEKSLLETEIMRRKELLHPIKSLPTHLLTRIFELYLEMRPKAIGKLQMVSKEWGHVVRNSPTLWTTIYVVGPFRDHHANLWKRYIDACILRSKDLPLKVRFMVDGFMGSEMKGLYSQGKIAFELLSYLTLFVSSRWVELDYTWRTGWRFLEFKERFDKLREITRQALSLQSLHLWDSCDLRYTDLYLNRLPDYLPPYGPSLRSLHIRNLPWEVVGPEDPMSSVQELTLEWNRAGSWSDLMSSQFPWLSLFPSLQSLTLRAAERPARFDDLEWFHTIPYAALELRSLKLVGPVPPWALKGLRLPALETLRIHENETGEHILQEDRCIPWFKVIHDFGRDVTSQIICLGPEIS